MTNIASAVADNSLFTQANDSIMEAESNLMPITLKFADESLPSYSEDKETFSKNTSMLNGGEFQSVQEDITFLEAEHKWLNKFQFDEIISRLNDLPGFSKCAARLNQLQTLDEFEEGEEPLSLESAKGFLLFVSEFKDLGSPILGLFSQGTLSVGWRIADNKHLLIEPLGENNIGFALIKPDLTSPDQKFRVNGRGSRQAVIEALRKHDVDKWINPA